MNPGIIQTLVPTGSDERRWELTRQVREHASGARCERLHPVRVRHAIACGQALIELRGLLGQGGWTRWLEEQCALNRMTASRYMRLASRADRLTPCMTIREAYIAAGIIDAKTG